ncbi:MAG: RAMP superfamily CRISPR-associated protein, partial [Calditerricola sp.]|nr:RAMP superfamily CRISPR-associated protein [Calditerricola sp.]
EVRLYVLSPLVVRREARLDTVEMRMPSLKGMLRFWWRALQGHAALEDIRKKEQALFGAAGSGKSPVRMVLARTVPPVSVEESQVFLLPHKRKGKVAYFPTGGPPFLMWLTAPEDKLEMYEHLLRTALLLGGLGARGRRGFGSLHIDPPPQGLEEICAWLNKASGANSIFAVETTALEDHQGRRRSVERIVLRKENPSLRFPYVQEVYRGDPLPQDQQAILKWLHRIGTLSSRHNSLYTGYTAVLEQTATEPAVKELFKKLKNEKKARLASPLVVTVARFAEGPGRTSLRPVVVRLKPVFPDEIQKILENQKNLPEHQRPTLLQDTTNAFILDVLKGGSTR